MHKLTLSKWLNVSLQRITDLAVEEAAVGVPHPAEVAAEVEVEMSGACDDDVLVEVAEGLGLEQEGGAGGPQRDTRQGHR